MTFVIEWNKFRDCFWYEVTKKLSEILLKHYEFSNGVITMRSTQKKTNKLICCNSKFHVS